MVVEVQLVLLEHQRQTEPSSRRFKLGIGHAVQVRRVVNLLRGVEPHELGAAFLDLDHLGHGVDVTLLDPRPDGLDQRIEPGT